MIVTRRPSRQYKAKAYPIGSKPGFVGGYYEAGKRLAEAAGIYKDIRPYLPETYIDPVIDKYSYKPRKRLSGYAGKALWSKKLWSKTGYQQYKKCCGCDNANGYYSGTKNNSSCTEYSS